jgi:adenosylcobyric acid synthase
LLEWAGYRPTETVDLAARREADLERLADSVEASLDLGRLARWIPLGADALENV